MSYKRLTSKHLLTVQRMTESTDSGAGAVLTPVACGEIRCLLQPMKVETRIQWQKDGIEVSHVAYLRDIPETEYDERYQFVFRGCRVCTFKGYMETDEQAHGVKPVKLMLKEEKRNNKHNVRSGW